MQNYIQKNYYRISYLYNTIAALNELDKEI